MSREDPKRYFEILELDSDASLREIENAYVRLKKLYSNDSMVISPVIDEFSNKRKKEILQQIEEAYLRLKILLNNDNINSIHEESLTSDNTSGGEKFDNTPYAGPVLKQIREKLGIQLHEISLNTKIRVEILENIELEKFDALPQEVYLKGHLRNYASCLLLNPKKVSDDYLKRYKEWKRGIEEKA